MQGWLRANFFVVNAFAMPCADVYFFAEEQVKAWSAVRTGWMPADRYALTFAGLLGLAYGGLAVFLFACLFGYLAAFEVSLSLWIG